jgi:hypothetical protein
MSRISFSVYLTRKDVLTRSTSPLRSGPMENVIHVVKQFQFTKQTKKVNYKTLFDLLPIHLMKASLSLVLIIKSK